MAENGGNGWEDRGDFGRAAQYSMITEEEDFQQLSERCRVGSDVAIAVAERILDGLRASQRLPGAIPGEEENNDDERDRDSDHE